MGHAINRIHWADFILFKYITEERNKKMKIIRKKKKILNFSLLALLIVAMLMLISEPVIAAEACPDLIKVNCPTCGCMGSKTTYGFTWSGPVCDCVSTGITTEDWYCVGNWGLTCEGRCA